MSAFLFPRRGYLGVLAAAFWAAPWLAAQAQPLTFERAQALAEQSAPENLARQAQVLFHHRRADAHQQGHVLCRLAVRHPFQRLALTGGKRPVA